MSSSGELKELRTFCFGSGGRSDFHYENENPSNLSFWNMPTPLAKWCGHTHDVIALVRVAFSG